SSGSAGGGTSKPDYVTQDEYYITDVKVKTNPTKQDYVVGDKVDLKGMTFTVTWNDGYVEETDASYAIPYPKTIAIDTTEISVHYDSFTFTIPVGGSVSITSIEITEVPARTVYVEGEYFNPSGMVVSTCLEDGTPYKEVTDYDYSPKTALTKSVTEITITHGEFSTTLPISVCDGFVREAEDGEVVGGEIARSGAVAPYASGNAFTRNFQKDGTLTFKVPVDKAYKVDIVFVGSSGAVKEYNGGMPLETIDMSANKLFALSVNGKAVTIGDEAIFHGRRAEEATYKLFANWENVKVGEAILGKGTNVVKFTFTGSVYQNEDDSPASAFYDKFIVIFKEQTEAPDAPDPVAPVDPTDPDDPSVTLEEIGKGVTQKEAEAIIESGAVKAGDTSVHPDYANSGVAGGFSDKGFAKNFADGAVLSYKFRLKEASTVKIKLFGSTTSTNTEVKANSIFTLYVGGKKITLDDNVKFAASGTAWEIQGMDFGSFVLEAGDVEIKIVFDVVGAEYQGVFLDYLEITVE
ncbi:MAG TPA: hypothetical protein DDY77_05365, partial [Clostridiales bacterium]|nr:hypothetical protein [Clostridiales bacterium]